MKEIKQQSGYYFWCNPELLKSYIPIDLFIKDLSLTDALDQIFKNEPLTYEIVEDKFIVVKTKPSTGIQDNNATHSIHGKVLNSKGEEVAGVSVNIKGTNIGTSTDDKGNFSLDNVPTNAILVISHIGFETIEQKASNKASLTIYIKEKTTFLKDVTVNYSNGYQTIEPEKATGSYNLIDNELINRSVTTNIIDRIENLTPGVLFNHGDAASTDQLLIRGRSTLYSNAQPLIVLNNFPYDGDLSSINPNEVESITILKDAASAAIWGARAGNGVIVIVTKRGKLGKPMVDVNSSVTFIQKPDLYSMNALSSSAFIDLEKNLYSQGNYDDLIQDNAIGYGHAPLTPVIQALMAGASNSDIDNFKQYDVRKDLSKYFYRTAVNQQHSVNVSGATRNVNYIMSFGLDHNLPNLVGQKYDRITIGSQNTFTVTKNLDINAGLHFVQSNTQSGNNPGYSMQNIYPYAQLADNKGNGLNLDNYYLKSFTDTASAGGALQNWKYNPLNDIGYTKNSAKIKDYLINVAMKYQFTPYLNLDLKYQYENALTTNLNSYSDSSFYARDLTNNFYQPGTSTYAVPIGGIQDLQTSEITSHQGRAQLSFQQTFKTKHKLSAIAGFEIKNLLTVGNASREYGYNQRGSIVQPQIDYVDYFTQYSNQYNSLQVPNPVATSQTLDRFISTYADVSYIYDNRFIFSGSARNDAANLFGVKTNQRGVPLWSIGGGWNLSNEHFYDLSWLPLLKLRATYGVNGNFSRLATAQTTISYDISQFTQATTATILNPPNPDLRWEQDHISNLGVDFSLKKNILSGTIEYYYKKATDLIAPTPIDPTLGLVSFNGASSSVDIYKNTANIKGHGVDLQLTSQNFNGVFKWSTNLIFSNTSTIVSKYLVPVSTNGGDYLNGVINPIVGKPVFAIYSYRWGGLDPTTGNPTGYIGKAKSQDYGALVNQTLDSSMQYNGPVQPTIFGALRNTFSYKHIALSFNISYKFGYYFRRNSLNYTSLFASYYFNGSGDYTKRWQKAGDEKTTNVPSMIYPSDGNRDQFYTYSSPLVERADNIRLEDIRLEYVIDRSLIRTLPFNQIRLYTYASNLGKLWVANKEHIDPYFNSGPKTGKSFAFGINLGF